MKESYPIHSYNGFQQIPWFFQMYQAVRIFTGQGVERNINVARSTNFMKSNKRDSVGDVPRQE